MNVEINLFFVGFHGGTSGNRFNSKMVELLASSSTSSSSSSTINNQENEPFSHMTKSTQRGSVLSTAPEMPTADGSQVHSKVLRRRIVNMLETLRKRSGTTPPSTSPKFTPSGMGSKSQPITFGQLRQATTPPSSSSITTSPPSASSISTTEEMSSSRIITARSYNDLLSIISDNPSITAIPGNRSSLRYAASSERLLYSPSLEQLLEQHNITPRKNEQNESKLEDDQQAKSPLTVDEILAKYYSKVKVPTTTDTNPTLPLTSYPHSNMGYFIGSSPTEWHSSQTNPYQSRPAPPPLLLNEQNRNRPPPPSYSISLTSGHRPPPSS